jgi:glucose-1-phosphate adenylyltransferase
MKHKITFSNLASDAWAALGSRFRPPLALVLSAAPSADLDVLTSQRCPAALPFAGRYRLIDFALSNCVNSGIESVGVVAQCQLRSLRAHLAGGRPWGLDRHEGGFALLLPHATQAGRDRYGGTAEAINQNWEFVSQHQADQVLILVGGEVQTMDLRNLVVQHHRVQADLTIAVVGIEGKAAGRYHTLDVDREGWARASILPGASRPGPLAMMGALLFSTEALSRRLREDAQQSNSTHDLFRDVIPAMIQAGDRVMTLRHTGYWNSVQSVHDYWQAHMDLVRENPALNLQDSSWPIYTQSETQPPMRIAGGGIVSHSLVSEGCVIEGSVEGSILSPGVHVAAGAVVRKAVVMHNTIIEERALVENAILDADVSVGAQARVGELGRHAPTLGGSLADPPILVGQGTRIPAGATIQSDPPSDDRRPPERRDAPAPFLEPRPELLLGTADARSR